MQHTSTYIIGLLFTTTFACGVSTERFNFTWNDINTRNVIEWRVDTAIIQEGSSMQELSCRVSLDSQEIESAIDNFGIPKAWTLITYTDSNDLAKKQKELQKKSSLHGITMMDREDKFAIDYTWVINQSSREIRNVAKTIRSAARRQGYRTRRELVGAFSSFVQALEYRIPPEHRVNDEGEIILTAGAMVPLDTLSKQWGDCDSKCMLFASLVHSIDLVRIKFIILDDHLFAAVQLAPTRDDHSIRYKGEDWVLIELTDAWPIGRVPNKHLDAISRGKYEVKDLN
jgi:hypothetical protein